MLRKKPVQHKVTRKTKSGKMVTYMRGSGSTKATQMDVESHPAYMKFIGEISDKYSEDLRPDGSFPRNSEAFMLLQRKKVELRKAMSAQSRATSKTPKVASSPKRTYRPKPPRRRKDSKGAGYYRIMGTEQWRRG